MTPSAVEPEAAVSEPTPINRDAREAHARGSRTSEFKRETLSGSLGTAGPLDQLDRHVCRLTPAGACLSLVERAV
jgi:hypothetical protein